MKTNLYINTGGELKKSESSKNNLSNYLSIMNSKSLTTNDSATAFTSPFNTIAINTHRAKMLSKKPFLKSKSNSKYSSLNIFTGYNKTGNNNIFLPKINSFPYNTQLFNNADKIVKDRKKQYMGHALRQTKSSILEKSKEICLNNYLITQLRDKRDEINNKQLQIFSQLNNSEKRFEIDYKNFIDFVEEINKKEKEEEFNLNNLKNISKNVELKLIEEMNKNKNLESKIESLVKQIIVLQIYGSFLHKVFYKPFIFDELKKENLKGKKYLSIANKILSLYEENKEDDSDIISDVEAIMDKYEYFEEKVVNIIKEKEELEQDVKETNNNYKCVLDQLKERKKDLEKENIKLKNEKKEINNISKEYVNYDRNKTNNLEYYLENINELGKMLGINSNKYAKNTKSNEILECSVICEQILKFLGEKENLINENINIIENIINNGEQKDKEIIENLIYERKKYNKKEKQLFLLNIQKNEEHDRKLKAVEKAKRIVIKGRKVFPDIKIIKKKNIKIKVEKNIEYEDFEYLNYSSDKEE